MKITRTWARVVVSLATMLFRLWKLFHAVLALGRQASWEETTLVTNLCWHGNNENRACKQVRFHSILDGSSLAHAIQVLMGPLLMNYGRMRCTEMKRLLGTELDTHTTCPHTTCPHTSCHHTTCSHTTCHFYFAWQARRLATSTCTLRGRRGTWRHLPPLCVAGVALGDMDVHFAWQAWHLRHWTGSGGAWHLWHWAGSGGALGSQLTSLSPRLLAWQAWHLATWTVSLRGRRGAWWHGSSLCLAGVVAAAVGVAGVAGVALGDMDCQFAWQAWHLATLIVTLRGRRETYGAGMVLVARLVPVWRRCRRGCWRGRCGTWRHGPSVCVAGVALVDMDRRFAWQAWHWWHRAVSGGALGSQLTLLSPRLLTCQAWLLATSTFTLRGRRGTWRHGRALCVAGVALMALGWLWWRAWFPVDAVVAAAVGVACVALGDINFDFAWQAWHLATSTFTLRGRRGTWRHQLSLCVAGMARGDIDLHFARQAWHLRHWTGSGGALGSRLTPLLPLLLAWQAWHLATSTSTLRGRRGTWRHRPAFCVAAVVLGDIDLHFAWQVWCLWH